MIILKKVYINVILKIGDNMNSKGFSLIELTMVIALISVISLIAVPITLRYIDQSHVEAAKASANVLLKSAQDYYSDIVTETGTFEYQEMSIADTKSLFNYTGKLPDAGYVTIDADSSINVYYVQYDYCVIVSSNKEAVVSKDLTKCGEDGALQPDYVLNNIILDGVDDFYDSGYSLFDTNKDFTIVASFTSDKSGAYSKDSPTVFHCMKEAKPYPGIAFDQMNANGRIAIKTAKTAIFSKAMYQNKNIIVIRRDTTSNTLVYYIFNSSNVITKTAITSSGYDFSNFDQHLIIGAYQTTAGVKGRFFDGTIHYFGLYMQALDDETIETIMNELKA